MVKKTYLLVKQWLADAFETRTDRITAAAVVFFVILNALKITIFNQILVPNADKWMFRYKFLNTMLVLIIFYPLLFRLRSRVLLVVFYILQVLYIMISMSYYLYFENYLHLEQFISNFYEGSLAVKNSSAPQNPMVLTAFIDLPFFVWLAAVYPRANRLRHKFRVLIYIAVALSVGTVAVTQYEQYKERNFLTHIAGNMFLGESRVVQRYGTLINNAVSIYNKKSTEEYINSFNYGKDVTNEKGAAEKPDIFIIQTEALDASIVQQKYNGEYVMPYLNSLTNSAVYYPYMMSYHLGGGTSDCEFSVINGIEPLLNYPAIKLTTYNAPNSFISRLTAAAYEVNAFHGNIARYYNRDMSFFKYGIHEYYDIAKMGLKDVGWGAPDSQVFDFALERSREAKKPFLSYIITMSSHIPYTNVSHYYNNNAYDGIPEEMARNYYNSMSYVDKAMEDFIKSVREEYDNAYIFIFGDHRSKVDSSNIFKQASVKIDDKLYEFVPLFIITPDGMKYREEKMAASFLDVGITILNASGIKYSIKSFGTDLLKPGGGNESKIPYRGLQWDRRELFGKISEALGR